MKEQVVSIVFLALLVIVPVGIVTLIIVNAVRGARARSGTEAAAREMGWSVGEASDRERLAALLGPTLFAMQGGGTNRLAGVARGTVGVAPAFVARYDASSTSPLPSLQRSGTYRLVAVQRAGAPQPLWVFAPRADALGSVAARLAGTRLESAAEPAWNGALVSSAAALGARGLSPAAAAALRGSMEEGGFLFLFKDCVVLMGPGAPDAAWTRDAARRAQVVVKALGG